MSKLKPIHTTLILALFATVLAIGTWQCSGIASNKAASQNNGNTVKPDPQANKVILLTSDNFEEHIKNGVVLVDFWASWCRPCRMQAPVIEEISLAMEGKAKIGKLDIDQYTQIADQYRIQSIPTLLIFKDGEVVHQFVGLTPKEEIIAELEKYTITKN